MRSIIGQMSHHLDHMANMLQYIDEYEYANHDLCIACTDSFLLDFRALYGFLLGQRGGRDAHRYAFLTMKEWQRPKTAATKRLDSLAKFVSKHRAHLSESRFIQPRQSLQEVLGVPSLAPEYLAQALLDYLDVLDQFIGRLPDSIGKAAWQSAVFNARYKTEVQLGIRVNLVGATQLVPFKRLRQA